MVFNINVGIPRPILIVSARAAYGREPKCLSIKSFSHCRVRLCAAVLINSASAPESALSGPRGYQYLSLIVGSKDNALADIGIPVGGRDARR